MTTIVTTVSVPDQLRALADLIESGAIMRTDIDVHFYLATRSDDEVADATRVLASIDGPWRRGVSSHGGTHWLAVGDALEFTIFGEPETFDTLGYPATEDEVA